MKIKIIFIVLNLLLLIFSFLAIKNQTFLKLDDYFTSLFFKSSFTDKTFVDWYKKVALIKIDSKFFDKEGVTPSTFHRGYYAKLLEKLQSYWVKNVVFDVYFTNLKYSTSKNKIQRIYNKSLEYFDKKLQKAIKQNVVLWWLPIWSNKILLPSSKLTKNHPWIGYVKSHINKNNINDGAYPYWIYDNKKFLTLWITAYYNKLYTEWKITKDIKITVTNKNPIFKNKILHIKTSNPKYNRDIILSSDINWDFIFTPLFFSKKIPLSYSIYDILHDEDGIYEDKLKWKTVFIWNTDESLNDIKLSYVWLIPWVMFHINNFLATKSNFFMYTMPIAISFIIILFIYLLWYLFVIVFKAEKLSIILFILVNIVIFIISFILFKQWIIVPLWTIIVFLLFKLILDIFHILWINDERREFISNIFDKYVGKKIREEKESKKNIWSTEKKEIALMFSDIASFTNISEKLSAEEVGKMLNTYFEEIWPFIEKSNWYIDKYIWDAIMAYWEDIKNTDKIAKAIIEIQRIHPKIKEKILEKIGKEINIKTRIWLHFWEAIVWDVGDIHWKIQPTALWDNVNLASRLEGINKYYGTKIMMSENFYNLIQNKENFAIRLIDKITVKWKTEPVKIYQLMDYKLNEITQDVKDYIKKYEEGISHYFKWNFEKAKEILNTLLILKLWQNDEVLKIFLERINYLIDNPPENWDGVWRFTTK
jgi:adenylate cyclase